MTEGRLVLTDVDGSSSAEGPGLLDANALLLSDPGSRTPNVEIDAGPVYELILQLIVFGFEQDAYSFDVGPQWFGAVRALASPELLAALDELAPRCWLWNRLLLLAWHVRSGKQALPPARFIQRLSAMPPQRLFDFLLGSAGHQTAVTPELIQQAVAGQRSARVKLGKVLFPEDPGEDVALQHLLRLAPERLQSLVVRIVERWYREIFREGEHELAARLATEARTKRIIGSSSPSRLLRAAAVGFHYLPRRSVRRVVLIPTIVTRPCLVTVRFGPTRLFCYPLADESPEDDELSAQLVKIHRALGDTGRLRILRALLRTERTLESLSRELQQTETWVGAQLVTLRVAGLVLVQMDERRLTYVIRPNLPSVVFRTLQAYLPAP